MSRVRTASGLGTGLTSREDKWRKEEEPRSRGKVIGNVDRRWKRAESASRAVCVGDPEPRRVFRLVKVSAGGSPRLRDPAMGPLLIDYQLRVGGGSTRLSVS